MDGHEIGYEGVNRIYLAQNKFQYGTLLNVVIKLPVPFKAGNFSAS
jgi:hypothetical protein